MADANNTYAGPSAQVGANQLSITDISSSSPSMSSREIAELTGKEHRHVMRDIEVLKAQVGDEFVGSVQTWTHPQNGQHYPEYVLNKDTTLCLVSGYSASVRMKIIKRWQALEDKQSSLSLNPANLSRLQLIEMAMQAEQERLVLEAKVEKIQPMADALIRIAHSDGGVCLTTAAKVLQQKPKAFIAGLSARGWIYRRPGNGVWHGYQPALDRGYLDQKVSTFERPDGSDKTVSQCLVTPKGIAKLAMLLGVTPMSGAM